MVVGVIGLTVCAGDNAPGATITPSGGGNRLLPIIAALINRQVSFEIAEHRAVPLVRKGPALFDQLKSRYGFTG